MLEVRHFPLFCCIRRYQDKELSLQLDEKFHRQFDPVPRRGLGEPPDSFVCSLLLVFDQAKTYRDILISPLGDSYIAFATFLHEIGEYLGQLALELLRRGLADIEHAALGRRPDIGEMPVLNRLVGNPPAFDML